MYVSVGREVIIMKYDTETHPAVYEMLQDMSRDIRELKDTQYEFQHETRHEIAGINQRLTAVEQDTAKLKQDVAVLKSDVSTLKEDVKELRQDVKDLHGEVKGIAGMIGGMQTRLNWWLVIAGIVLALLQYLKP